MFTKSIFKKCVPNFCNKMKKAYDTPNSIYGFTDLLATVYFAMSQLKHRTAEHCDSSPKTHGCFNAASNGHYTTIVTILDSTTVLVILLIKSLNLVWPQLYSCITSNT